MVASLLLVSMAACRERYSDGAVYSAAPDTAVQVVFDSTGKAFRMRNIGTLEDAVTSIRISSMNDSSVLLVVSGMRANFTKVPARRLKEWLVAGESWDSIAGAATRSLGPETNDASDEAYYHLDLVRPGPRADSPNYWVILTARDATAWLRTVRPGEVGRFVSALAQATDSAIAMSTAR